MPAAIPLAMSAAGAIGGAIKNRRDKKAAEAAQAAQAPAASGGGGGGGYTPNAQQQAGYSDFAKTGGFSPADLSAIRARAVSPVRAVYANAQREVNRSKALQGGYSPGFGTLQARMAREQGQETSDAATGAEANIAEMVQRGKLAGLAGLQGSSGGGGGGAVPGVAPEEQKKRGFWGKLGGALGKVGQVALPIAMNAYGNGPGKKPILPSRQTAPNYSTMPGF